MIFCAFFAEVQLSRLNHVALFSSDPRKLPATYRQEDRRRDQGAGSGTAENIDVPDQQPAPSFGDNSLAGGPADADPESEVAAFANREQGRDGTTA